MRRLAIVRPEPGASATAEAAARLGLDPLVLPLFAVEPIAWQAPDVRAFDALLLTSANAIRHSGSELEKLRGLSVYAVGEATAAQARDAGFTVAATGSGGVDALLERIEPGLRLLHLCGEHRRRPASAPQAITPLSVYRSAALAKVPGLGRIAGEVVAIHSPRAGARLAELAARQGLDISGTAIAAISAEAALAAGSGWQSVEAAEAPSESCLLALAARLCNKSG
ncbi:MAG TPA: uroporphyrinogen-III synthase [Sphingomicrobium sp.]|nr:uroporphyrinogen-III synthase [Sphingomicrobium sp.]